MFFFIIILLVVLQVLAHLVRGEVESLLLSQHTKNELICTYRL